MSPAKTKISPKDKLLSELNDAKEAGKTELRVSLRELESDAKELLAILFSITTLKDLTLNVGTLKTIPPGLGNLTLLESLRVEVEYGKKLDALPPDIGTLTSLERLTVYSLELSELPEEIGDLINLKKLTAWSNKLKTLPASFGRLAKLEELELQRNEIRSLPKELGALKNLEELDLGNNQLADLPEDFAGMVKLHTLNLEDNKLTSIPLGVCKMPALRSLNLEQNALTEIPDAITAAKSLQSLFVPRNKIKKIPEALFGMNVISIDLEDNQVTEIPPGIVKMKTLGELKMRENPLKGVPAETIQEGKEAILEHLGFVKREVVTGDLPDDKERAAVVKKYQERIDAFFRKSKSRMHDSKMLARIVEFITGKNNVVPAGRLDDHYSFSTLDDVLAPYAEWTFVDRRILRFMTQGAWHFQMPGHSYFKGYAEDLLSWLKKQIAVETNDTLFSLVAKEVAARGVDEDEFLRIALDKLSAVVDRNDGSPTSFGRYLLDVMKSKIDIIDAVAKEDNELSEKLSGLLIRFDVASFEKLAPTLLEIKANAEGEIHIPHGPLAKVCAASPAKFEGILLEAIEKSDCVPCKAEAAKILADSYRAKHGKKALEITKATLKTISENMNTKDRYYFSWDGKWLEGTACYIGWAIDTFGEDVRQSIFEYAENTHFFSLDVADLMAKTFGQKAIDVIGEGLNMKIEDDGMASHYRRIFTLLAPLDYSKFYDKAWEIARSEFKQVRQTACMALGKLPANVALPKAKELLASKKAHEREAGVLVLSLLDSAEAKKILEGLLDTEKGDDARDLIVESFYGDDPTARAIDRAEVDKRVASANARGKLDKPIAKWLDEKKLPALTWVGGKKAVDADTVRFLAYRQTRRKEIEADPEARAIFPLIDRKTSGDFAEKLLSLLLKNGGATAKNRFALALVGLLGDEAVIAPLEKLAVDERNENATRTIGLVGTDAAARSLDRIAKVFRTKYPNVRQIAQEGFAAIADGMGLTPFELADTMLPDFGFDGLSKSLGVAKTKLKATIGSDGKLALVDDANKIVKIPAKASAKEKAEIKALSQEIQDAAKQFRSSLEYYLIIQRQWRAADWKKFFLAHPLAFAFARSLIWGSCQGTKITTTFRVTTDGALLDVRDAPVSLPKDGAIALVHALDLSSEERAKWQAVLDREKLTPPFSQITRPLFAVEETDKAKTLSFTFEDKEVAAATFKSRAERLGWRRGSVVDSGEVSGYKKAYPRARIDAFIRTANLSVQLDFDATATLKDFFFVKSGSVVTGSYTYDEPSGADDPRLIRFADVPPIIYSETFSDLRNIIRSKDAED